MFGLFEPKKPFRAQVNSIESMIDIPAGDNLLNAALNAGLSWPHNCRVGSCGTCRCRLLSGKIKPLNDFSYVLDEEELDQGMVLACQTRLLSDIEVSVSLDSTMKILTPAQTVSGVVSGLELLTHDILELKIQLDADFPSYLAGQYAEIAFSGISEPRSYSFAYAPSQESPGQLTFFVRRVSDGEMSSWLHDECSVGTKVSVTGPHGSFYLRDAETPMLCIAGGSGLAPIKALLEEFAHQGLNRKVTFLFGARTQKDLYCVEQMNQIQDSHPDQFTFVPILSHEQEDSDWPGLRGFVTEFITHQGFDFATCQSYLCGPPPMIDSAIDVLTTQGLSKDQIFFDKFLDASHLPGGKR